MIKGVAQLFGSVTQEPWKHDHSCRPALWFRCLGALCNMIIVAGQLFGYVAQEPWKHDHSCQPSLWFRRSETLET
jgi:hypothetical protein